MGLELSVQGSGCKVYCLGFQVWDSGFYGERFRVQGKSVLGFQLLGLGYRPLVASWIPRHLRLPALPAFWFTDLGFSAQG